MADNRTMAQMLQAPIEGYEDAIVVPPINANNFKLKQPLINLVQSNKFTDGEARDWLDKEPPRSILTWDDLVSNHKPILPHIKKQLTSEIKITNYFPRNQRNSTKHGNFLRILRQCPRMASRKLHQLDLLQYLNSNDQDALDSADGWHFFSKDASRSGVSTMVLLFYAGGGKGKKVTKRYRATSTKEQSNISIGHDKPKTKNQSKNLLSLPKPNLICLTHRDSYKQKILEKDDILAFNSLWKSSPILGVTLKNGATFLGRLMLNRCLQREITLGMLINRLTIKLLVVALPFPTNNLESLKKVDLIDVTCEEYSQENWIFRFRGQENTTLEFKDLKFVDKRIFTEPKDEILRSRNVKSYLSHLEYGVLRGK
ncbi:hypothetical protein Tco_0769749 [Tanacetum coccineum]|uniref:Reverse transcriptase domain-containing protein n=1 Tax=Tanacetum coccineum TaxID=301880 RepID=A0ABQ4ZE71_9ASTR